LKVRTLRRDLSGRHGDDAACSRGPRCASCRAAAPGRHHRSDRHRPGQQGRRPRAPTRHIAIELDRSPSTVRRWLRRATRSAHLDWLWQRGSQALIRLDPDAFNQLPRATHPLRDALTRPDRGRMLDPPTAGLQRTPVDLDRPARPRPAPGSTNLSLPVARTEMAGLAIPHAQPCPAPRTPPQTQHRHRAHHRVSVNTKPRQSSSPTTPPSCSS
jgi:hypothetical protein